MSSTITWSIKHLHTNDDSLPRTVHIAMAGITAEQDGQSVCVDEHFWFEPPADNFIPYDQLTEAQVLEWIFASMTPERKAQFEEGANAALQQKINPPDTVQSPDLPWA